MTPVGKDHPRLPDALNATCESFETAGGWRLAYYADRTHDGRPLVLVHSINAASSSFEMRPLFEHYRASRPVYSLDLPGFGHSERRLSGYSPDVYARAIADFLTQVVQGPADVVALSLSGEFAARAALLASARLTSLVLISPTGFGAQSLPSPRASRRIQRLLDLPLVGRTLYGLVASRRSIGHFLGRSFVGAVPEEMIDYAHATSHQPGARHAPLTFLSMGLFTPNAIEALYAPLEDLSVLVIADQDPYIRFEYLPDFIAAHPNWHLLGLAPHRGLPHWEKLDETTAALDAFWWSSPQEY